MIYLTGDTHGTWTRFSVENFPEQKEMTKDDYVIILGDFGIWTDDKQERYWLDWLNEKPFTTLFIDGNHENFDRLYAMESKPWNGGMVHYIRDSIIHLQRGYVFSINGHKFFTFGGASSHDISAGILEPDDPDFKIKRKALDEDPYALYRVNHLSWWKEELPSEDEMERGLEKLKENDFSVDYILSHCAPTSIMKVLDEKSYLYKPDCLTEYFDEILNKLDYKLWVFGHYHINKMLGMYNAAVLYEQIVPLELKEYQ